MTIYDPMTAEQVHTLARIKDVEANMLAFVEDWKYIPTLPRGKDGERAILMLDYLLPDLAHIVATQYVGMRGWRRHNELAITKPRRIIGGLFDDLVTYVPIDEPDDPIIINHPQTRPTAEFDALPWTVGPPTVTDTFEERDE